MQSPGSTLSHGAHEVNALRSIMDDTYSLPDYR